MDKKKSKQQDVLVIGAGASGMMTAITAARRGLSVTVLEHMDKPGKKILATGNGKCNFTNLKMSPRCYYGDHGLVQEILKQFTVEDTLVRQNTDLRYGHPWERIVPTILFLQQVFVLHRNPEAMDP